MPITRELKKRFMAIEDRLEKIEKRKPIQQVNGEPVVEVQAIDTSLLERIDLIETVLQIPGEVKGEVQVASAWRDTVETILTKLEDRLIKVELRGAWTPDEAKLLERRVKSLMEREKHLTQETNDNRPRLKKLEELVHNIERKPPPLNNIAPKMAEDIREHEVELFGSDGTGGGLVGKIKDLTKMVNLLNRGVGFVIGPIVIILILIRLITLLF